jgi:hypothetical protein
LKYSHSILIKSSPAGATTEQEPGDLKSCERASYEGVKIQEKIGVSHDVYLFLSIAFLKIRKHK